MIVRCLYDKLVPVSDLKFHPDNANIHSDDQIKRLADILEYQGWRYPVKISNQSGYITSGHGRVLAAKLNNWTEVPCNFQDYESKEQEYADVQADNAIASWAELNLSKINVDILNLGPELDIDMLGIKDFVLEPSEKFTPQCDEDEVPEPVEPKTKLGDLYRLGNHRLMCGDSTSIDAVEKLMNGEKADMVFTDPPYGIDYQDVKHKHKKIENDENQDGIQSLLITLLSFDCPIFICCNWKCYSTFEKAMRDADRAPKACIVWDKTSRVQNLDKFGKQHEFILYHGPFGGEKTVDVDVWQCKRQVLLDHPTSKPVELIERAICHFKRGNILDLFGGSGSTLIACEKTNRKCYMMELDPHYCDVIVTRWEKYTGQKSECLTK